MSSVLRGFAASRVGGSVDVSFARPHFILRDSPIPECFVAVVYSRCSSFGSLARVPLLSATSHHLVSRRGRAISMHALQRRCLYMSF